MERDGVVMCEGFGTLYRRNGVLGIQYIHTHGVDVEERCIIHNDCLFFLFWTKFQICFLHIRDIAQEVMMW